MEEVMNKAEEAVRVTVEEPAANRYTPDAQERAARLRAIGEEFPDDADPRTLTEGELRMVRQTSIDALEQAARLAEATPAIARVLDVVAIRDMIAYELAYGGMRDEAKALGRRVDRAILRRKLKVAKMVRVAYRMAKGYVTADEGDAVRPLVDALGRALVPKRRKPAPPDEAVTKK